MIDAGEVLVMEHVSKTFGGQRALDDVSFEVRAGEIHALLGTNGSGKSTLIKILAGYYTPDEGASAIFQGEPLSLGDPPAPSTPIRFIHQDLGLLDSLEAAENVSLVQGFSSRWWVSSKVERAKAHALLEGLGVHVDVADEVRNYTRAEQTMLAIARAVGEGLERGAVLVLDEPTASLPGPQVRLLFGLLGKLKARGVAIIFVTHRLGEVLEIADRLTILRDGRLITTQSLTGLDNDQLVELLLGHPLPPHSPAAPMDWAARPPALSLLGVVGDTLNGVDVHVGAGEIVGVTGVVGSGYDELLGGACGARPGIRAAFEVGGDRLDRPSTRACIRAGIAYVPADRKRLSTILDWTIRENLTLPMLAPSGPLRWLSPSRESRMVVSELAAADVRPADPEKLIRLLSGGNQQKVVLARWLRCQPRALLLDEPTNGIDTGAKRTVYDALRAMSARGIAVLLTSQDPEELTTLCDRVLVMRDGRIGAELTGDRITPQTILAESLRVSREPVGA